MSAALLIVDVQNDFCPGGALPVAEGDLVAPILSRVAKLFADAGRPVFASRDWHPAHTVHFATDGGPWPVHCVRGTRGAEFHPDLHLPRSAVVVSKGMAEDEDAYSAFQATSENGYALPDLLGDAGITHLYVGGLATDYCVKASALDALTKGLSVTVLEDAVRAVDVEAGDGDRALAEMQTAGAILAPSRSADPAA